jgi:hypothetical protein
MRLRLTSTLAALTLAACSTPDKNEIALVNPGFEAPLHDGEVEGWMFSQHAGPASYEITRDDGAACEGAASLRIKRTRDQVYGSIAQTVPIAAYIGKSIEVSAKMSTEDVGPKGWGLMLTFTGGVAKPRSEAKPLTGTQHCTDVVIRRLVPAGAQELEIAALLNDRGSAWIDAVRVRVVQP